MVFTALILVVLMISAAMTVDLGMQRVARADLQALADVVALDLARELDGRTVGELQAPMEDAAAEAVSRNPGVIGSETPSAEVELGDVGVDGLFHRRATGTPTAVKVTARTTVEFAFAAFTGVTSGAASRSAVASSVQSACYSVGSYAAAVDTTSSPVLDPLIDKLAEQTGGFANGSAVGQAIGYQGLASASVRLGDVAADLGIVSVTELASSTVTLKDWYHAIHAGVAPGASIALEMLDVLDQQAKATVHIDVGRIIGIDSGSGSLGELRANVLDLVLGSLYLINGTNGVDLYLSNALERFTYLGIEVKAIQGPHLYCGQPGSAFTTGASSATEQLTVSGQGNLNSTTVSTTLPAIPGITTASAALTAPMWSSMPFTLSVASTATSLDAVRCGSPSGIDLSVAHHLARLSLTNIQYSEAAFDTTIDVAGASVAVAVTVGSANANVDVTFGTESSIRFPIDVPPQSFDTPYATQTVSSVSPVATLNGTPSVRVQAKEAIPGLVSVGADIAYLLSEADLRNIGQSVVDAVNAAVFDLADPNSLTHQVVAPLLSLGGIRLAGSDIQLMSQPPMECGQPSLRG